MTERMRGGRVATTAVIDEWETATEDVQPFEAPVGSEGAPRSNAGALDPLYPVALLKIAMAMKKLNVGDERHFEAILDSALHDMVIDREDFGRYLNRNMGRLMLAVRSRGY